ncbi:MAG: hypothetical protein JWM68_76 [Verrucomicrobiales bacterium]|nr:hypothetical protein [Verrucomicrobiales bacterium]
MTVDPGTTNEVSVVLPTLPITFSQPFDPAVGFEPTTVAWVNWITDYNITITKARFWNDPAKLLRVNLRPVRIEYVTVWNDCAENFRVVDVNTHRLYGIVYGTNDSEHDHFTTFRFVNRVNLMFRQPFNAELHRVPTGHVRIPAGGNWNVFVSQPAGYRFNGDVLLSKMETAP